MQAKKKPTQRLDVQLKALRHDDESVHVRIDYTALPNRTTAQFSRIPLVELRYKYADGGIELSEATTLLSGQEKRLANAFWREHFGAWSSSSPPLIQSNALFNAYGEKVFSHLSPDATILFLAEEMQRVLNYAMKIGLIGPKRHVGQVFIGIEDVIGCTKSSIGEAHGVFMRLDPRGLAASRNNLVAHEFAHIMQFEFGSGGITRIHGANLVEGGADLFATGYDLERLGMAESGVGILNEYRKWGFNTAPLLVEYLTTGSVSIRTCNDLMASVYALSSENPKMYKYAAGARLVTERLLINEMDVRKTMHDAFRAVEIADFVIPINLAHEQIANGELAGVLRS